MFGTALMPPSEVRPTHATVLALLECSATRLWVAVVIHDDVALPDLGPCAGDRITVLMTAFLVDRVIVLSQVALDEVEVTVTKG